MSTNSVIGAADLEGNESELNLQTSESSRSGCGFQAAGFLELARDPDLWLYRERTMALLKRYLRLSIEVGRLPSLLGRELFRSKVTSYRMSSFEDAVIFVHDVERALDQLDPLGKDLIAVIVFQDYSQDEAAEVLRCGRRTVCRHFPEVLDQISDIFLEGGLLNRLPTPPVENSCQAPQGGNYPLTTSRIKGILIIVKRKVI